MRFVVLLFGLISVVLTGSLGVLFLATNVIQLLRDQNVEALKMPTDMLEQYKMAEFGDTGIFLLIAALYGLLGTVLAFLRCGWQGALLLLVPVLGAAIMHPATIVFTALQGFTALLCFFVFPLPLNATTAASEDDDDEKPKPKPKPKAKTVDDDDDEDKPRPKPKIKPKAKSKKDDDDD
jgi:hypothetical protein